MAKPEKFNVCIMCAKETVILEKTVHFVISVRPAKHTRRNQVENRHVLITDVRNWIGSRERNGTRLWKATENRTNANERGWLLWLPSFCLQDTYTYLRIRTRILGYSV